MRTALSALERQEAKARRRVVTSDVRRILLSKVLFEVGQHRIETFPQNVHDLCVHVLIAHFLLIYEEVRVRGECIGDRTCRTVVEKAKDGDLIDVQNEHSVRNRRLLEKERLVDFTARIRRNEQFIGGIGIAVDGEVPARDNVRFLGVRGDGNRYCVVDELGRFFRCGQ